MKGPGDESLSVQLARRIAAQGGGEVTEAARQKLRLCLLDFLTCNFEARDLPWARQAAGLAQGAGPATIICTSQPATAQDAAFANAVAGHGLVREDMHTGSVSHFGVVVLPALLAVAQENGLSGRDLTDAAVYGYEVGAKVGRALVTPEFARVFRPTGFTGPLAATAGICRLLRMTVDETTSALAFAANMAGGLNQWPHAGTDEMYFHAGQAAMGAIRAVRLAQSGARGSADALDGEAGLIRAYRPDRTVPTVRLFDGEPEILSVYFKAAPVCNFAQTPCQAALRLATEDRLDPAGIAAVEVCVSQAALAYPGCDHAGPFATILQAKMSIQFAVAAALADGQVNEASYRRLDDPALLRLAQLVTVKAAPDLTAAFPSRQGAEVTVTLADGRQLSHALADVVPADEALICSRFHDAAHTFLGPTGAEALGQAVDGLDDLADINHLMRLAVPAR